MIIELTVKNWASFRDETVFSFVATREKRLLPRIPEIKKSPALRISPVAVLYGGNASGKTNLCNLFFFLKNMMILPPKEGRDIPLDSFALSSDLAKLPTEITLTFLANDDKIYKLRIVMTRNAILEETLCIVKRNGEDCLYSRKENQVTLKSSALQNDEDAKACVRLVASNQLFLGFAGSKNVKKVEKPYFWFTDQLNVLSPQASFRRFFDLFESNPTDIRDLSRLLHGLDTGICKLEFIETSLDAVPPVFSESEWKEKLNDGDLLEVILDGIRYTVSKTNDQLTVKKLVSYHQNSSGNLFRFDLRQESEGTIRLLNLLPAFIDLEKQDSRAVYVIDELDRSWHYLLSKRLLEIYLSNCSKNTRTQLLFSTHDLM
ncbi:MAG: ATP-binding protein, partial [Victivallales bacterium]|nr:ATP-binding protein [Victivallales bacterium]